MKRYLLLGLTITGAIVSYWGVSHIITRVAGVIIDKILELPEDKLGEIEVLID